MARPIHFEIHADDPARAMAFYTQLFGWEFQEIMPGVYWLAITGPDGEPGINGGLMKRREGQSGDKIMAYVCTIGVDDVDAAAAKLMALGGEIALDKHAIGGVGWQVYGKDPEGNVFGMHQEDPTAADQGAA
jgi:predicted enzyme related to lactoylglutathione lyase